MTATDLARRGNGGVVIPSDPITLGNVLAASGFFADSRDAAQAAVKVMAGQELGFGPIASMTGIYIVKGRVTLSANLMAAAIKRHPAYTFRVKDHTAEVCTIDFIEDGQVIGTSTFTMQDAKDAGLAGSETYRKFPKNMLYARALSNGAKWYCPDVFGGGPIYTPDELTDRVTYDADGQIAAVVEDAAPAPEPAEQLAPEPDPDSVATITKKRAGEIFDSAQTIGVADKLQLAASHVHGADVGDCTTKGAATEALRGLTTEQADKVEQWIEKKADEQAATS